MKHDTVLFRRLRRSSGPGAYAEGGLVPELAFDFTKERYFTNRVVKSFADALTYATTGLSTTVNSDGDVAWPPHNLLTWSEDFSDSDWTKTTTTVDGDTITHTADGGSLQQNYTATVGAQYTVEIEAKNIDASYFRMYLDGTSIWFDATDFSVGTDQSGDATSTALADDWYRLKATVTAADTGFALFFAIQTADGGGTEETGTFVRLRKPRLYRSDLGGMVDNPATQSSYVPTEGSAVYLRRHAEHAYIKEFISDGAYTLDEDLYPLEYGGELVPDPDFDSYADQAAAEAAGYVFTGCTFDAANDQIGFDGSNANVTIHGVFSFTPGSVYQVVITAS
ncbi:MAG: hypothetical protein GY945_06120, partial [Rhodobacteraceae bacterium]|nr:hypothetical protein [Paracoccaceae bacterium]